MSKISNYPLRLKIIASTILLIALILFCNPALYAQYNDFDHNVQIIKKKVLCCSVPFAASTKRKVDNIAITQNGNITLSYSDKKPEQTFNILKLYKEEKGATGIDTILSGKFIQFYVSKEKIRLIRFATSQDAKKVYAALLRLLMLGKTENIAANDLNFDDTQDAINSMLAQWAEGGNIVTVSAQQDGNVSIINARKQSLQFNFFDLRSGKDNGRADDNGIETIACDVKTHVPLAWINFYTDAGNAAFIRLDCNTPKAELDNIRKAFLHLKSLCSKSTALNSTHAGAIYFVSRNTILSPVNKMLAGSIRSIDKKDEGDTTISICSNGEGWLDKDSLPVGEWKFYSKNHEGKKYLFKSGAYQRTTAPMFEVVDIDSTDLFKNYGLSFYNLQQEQLHTIPFIKSNQWDYYHANGKVWKTVNFKNSQVPVITNIVMNAPSDQSSKLIIVLKEDMDEWIIGELNEYNDKGGLYKKLQYQTTGEVFKKMMYNNSGSIINTEEARPYQNPVLPIRY